MRALLLLLALACPTFGAGDFNGSTGYYDLTAAPVTDYPYTWACLVRKDTLSGNDTQCYFGTKADDTKLTVRDNATSFQTSVENAAGTGRQGTSNKTLTSSTWYLVVVVGTSSTARRVYVDGSFVGYDTASSAIDTTPDTVTIGASWDNSTASQFCDGAIGWAALWNVALSPDEIGGLTMGGARRVKCCRPESLKMYTGVITGDANLHCEVGDYCFTKSGTIAQSDQQAGGFVRPGLGSFTPADLADIVTWQRSDMGVTGTTTVTKWADESSPLHGGFDNDLDGSNGTPALIDADLNGRPGIKCVSGESDALYGEPAPFTAAPGYVWVVIRMDSTNNLSLSIFQKALNDNEAWSMGQNASTPTWQGDTTAGANDRAQGTWPGAAGDVLVVRGTETTTTNRAVTINGGYQGTNAGSSVPLLVDRWSIGGAFDATPNYSSKTYYEVIMTTSLPSNALLEKLNTYFAALYPQAQGLPWRFD